MKKRLCISAFLLLTGVCASRAQVAAPNLPIDVDNAGPDFSATSAAKVKLPLFVAVSDPFSQPGSGAVQPFAAPTLSTALAAEPAAADPPGPSPNPRFIYGGRDDYRWQLNLSLTWVRFQSSAFDSNTFGVKTTVTYFLNNWLGVEGSVTAAVGPSPTGFTHSSKMVFYGGGPKVAWRQKRWEPWLHGIFGGAREVPQTALGSHNSYSIMVGGGADYRVNPRLSYRAEADYVLTHFFGQSQSNFQLAGGIVFHF